MQDSEHPTGNVRVALKSHPQFSEDRARLLDEAGRTLSGAEDYESAVRLAARCPVPALADLAVLILKPDGREERVEVAHASPHREPLIRDLLGPALSAIHQAAERDLKHQRHFRWLPSVTQASTQFLARADPKLPQLLRDLAVRSLIIVPLRAGGRILGAMALARTETAQAYHAADLATAQVIARRAAVAIEQAQLAARAQVEVGRRNRLEEALQKWIRVFGLAGWGAAIVDGTDLRIDAVNPAFARMHGYPDPDSLTGRLFTDLLPPDRSGEPGGWPQLKDQPDAYESVHLRADGKSFPVLTDVTGLETGPSTASYVVTLQDVTELKRAEERLRGAQRMEAVGRLAGGVAHEVNNMMTIILGFGDLLAAATNLPPDRLRDVDEIRKAAIRTARVTQQLLAFSRQQILQPAHLRLDGVVAEMSSVLRHLLPANVHLETALSAADASVHVDRAQLDQVLINLAFNARDAMSEGGTLRLETGSRHYESDEGRRLIGIPIQAGRYACLRVTDTGHGMDPATASQVFEPFFTTKPTGSGTGLGLATVYGIVKQSGGFVWVDSTRGEGTTFTVCLPQLTEAAAIAEPRRPAPIQHQPRGDALVLVVEDEAGVRELARRILEGEGYQVLEVTTGAEAAAVLDSSSADIDLVLSDVIVADMGTVELERRIRERRPGMPILYMSGYSREDVVQRGLVPEDRPFIQKPFTATELTEEVGRELAAAAARGGAVTT
jgi:PAS domain S-box-containing protein